MKGFTALLSALLICGFLMLLVLGSALLSLTSRLSAEHADVRSTLRSIAEVCSESLPLILASGRTAITETIRLGKHDCEIEELEGDDRTFAISVQKSGVSVMYEAVFDESDFSTSSITEVTTAAE